jgi:ribosomal-protein-alanine N-acetyltransferase
VTRIQTDRLVLVAVSAALGRALLDGDRGRAAGLLGADLPLGWPDRELTGILPRHLDQIAADPAAAGFGVWIVLVREPRTAVGSAGFLGPADRDGTVEVGYGIHPSFRGQGYATEAAGALRDWALARSRVRRITARCDETNAASIRVLEKLGMRRTGTRDGTISWESGPVSRAGT